MILGIEMKKKILIIEDDSSIAELQKDYLEVADFDVIVCANGLEGLKALQENEVDLLILDIMLPGMDGLEILRSMKGLSLGADDYITKPFSPGELVARVKAHLENYERLKHRFSEGVKKGNTLTIRGLKIEKDSHRVFVLGQEVSLAQKEFGLLLYLAQNPNRVFGREELFERVWGIDAMGDSATVTVHIARVREKIEIDPSTPQYVETVWGAGYRFRV